MITQKTIFILGAGASVPYGYPTGEALRNDICRNFVKRIISISNKNPNADFNIKDIIEYKARPFSNAFLKSSIPSIDLFLARNRDFSDIGKMAIVSSILEAEKHSHFREDMEVKYQDWYSYLFRKMTEDLIDPESYKDFDNNRVAFITFNYDRSLEHFLYESLLNSFRSAPEREIISQLRSIDIIHVYGIVDRLAWQGGETQYKDEYSLTSINRMKNNIRLFHERIPSDVKVMEAAMRNASRFYFLGFGYAKENLEVLKIRNFLDGSQDIYGTAVGMTSNEILETYNYLRINFREKQTQPNNPMIEDLDCYKLSLLSKIIFKK